MPHIYWPLHSGLRNDTLHRTVSVVLVLPYVTTLVATLTKEYGTLSFIYSSLIRYNETVAQQPKSTVQCSKTFMFRQSRTLEFAFKMAWLLSLVVLCSCWPDSVCQPDVKTLVNL